MIDPILAETETLLRQRCLELLRAGGKVVSVGKNDDGTERVATLSLTAADINAINTVLKTRGAHGAMSQQTASTTMQDKVLESMQSRPSRLRLTGTDPIPAMSSEDDDATR